MTKKYIVTLNAEERSTLGALISKGKAPARKLLHARILLKADCSAGGPGWPDQAISEALDVSLATILRVRQLLVEEGLDAALNRHKPRRTYLRKLDGKQEAQLVALSCSESPKGHARWTLRLLADKMVELEYVDSVSHETIRQVLKKTKLSPG
jgi:transposase